MCWGVSSNSAMTWSMAATNSAPVAPASMVPRSDLRKTWLCAVTTAVATSSARKVVSGATHPVVEEVANGRGQTAPSRHSDQSVH
jgi:hypothetical protein